MPSNRTGPARAGFSRRRKSSGLRKPEEVCRRRRVQDIGSLESPLAKRSRALGPPLRPRGRLTLPGEACTGQADPRHRIGGKLDRRAHGAPDVAGLPEPREETAGENIARAGRVDDIDTRRGEMSALTAEKGGGPLFAPRHDQGASRLGPTFGDAPVAVQILEAD